MWKILFVCGKNKIRSITAENIFSEYPDLEVRSAGADNDAAYKLSSEDILWADVIYCMEQIHKQKILNKFKKFTKDKKIIVLDIKDKYAYMDEELIGLLKKKVSKYL